MSEGKLNFSLRTLLEIIAISAVVVTFMLMRRDMESLQASTTQPVSAPPNGRFSIVEVKAMTAPLLLDTQTGETWARGVDASWVPIALPVKPSRAS